MQQEGGRPGQNCSSSMCNSSKRKQSTQDLGDHRGKTVFKNQRCQENYRSTLVSDNVSPKLSEFERQTNLNPGLVNELPFLDLILSCLVKTLLQAVFCSHHSFLQRPTQDHSHNADESKSGDHKQPNTRGSNPTPMFCYMLGSVPITPASK